MSGSGSILRSLLLAALLLQLSPGIAVAAEGPASSGLGAVAIPQPPQAAYGESCVEPVDVMRREHMRFLDHQRDRTVIDGERGSRYSLAGCLDCHNPQVPGSEAVRYGDPQHFCTTCHSYASVRIDCFECHADRGDGSSLQGSLMQRALAAQEAGELDLATLRLRLENGHGE